MNSRLKKLLENPSANEGMIDIEVPMNRLFESFKKNKDENEPNEDYVNYTFTTTASFVELAIFNNFFYKSLKDKKGEIKVKSFGEIDYTKRIKYGAIFDETSSFWFMFNIDGLDDEFIFQTQVMLNSQNELTINLTLSSKNGYKYDAFLEIFNNIKKIAFNSSEYVGKCIKVKVKDGNFDGIEIIKFEENDSRIILTPIQERYINHFINRLKNGGVARYLLNGVPGTGKTESIRKIIKGLVPHVTFVIPDFSNVKDLSNILESCEIFNNCVVIMDDIDLQLGSREANGYTKMLGEFLSFFDGVKKRKVSLLGSTNDKKLVDKAAERPGRFNLILDYGYLTSSQISNVCDIHLPSKWNIKEVVDKLSGNIDGKKTKLTGAFIANFSENLKEMMGDSDDWSLDDTLSLIEETYKGFYASQVQEERDSMGFKK